jgi:hypothetical protein
MGCGSSKDKSDDTVEATAAPINDAQGNPVPQKSFKMRHPGSCTGMFWRSNGPPSAKHRLKGGSPDWPRNGAVLRGVVYGNDDWLEVLSFKQAGGAKFVPTPGCWMQFNQGGRLLFEV